MHSRAAAARVLNGVIGQGKSLDQMLSWGESQIKSLDIGLLRELCYGTLRWHPRLEIVASHFLHKKLKPRDGDIYALILCALYQLEYTRIPPHAAINEAVEGCRALNKPWASGMVNAVLRRFQREGKSLDKVFSSSDSYQGAHPGWLIDAFRHSWPEQFSEIIEANNQRGPMSLRVNTQRSTRDAYMSRLETAGLGAEVSQLSPVGIRLRDPVAVNELPGFAEGLVSVQDEAAQLCALLLDSGPGQRVLDACCAPGGKTCHLLELQPDIGELNALDIDVKRLTKVEDNLERLGLSAGLRCADATCLDDWWDGRAYERILLDAPCSATGVVRRHPDIKILRKPEDIAKLSAEQGNLLRQLWKALAVGGKLLYATCSVLKSENDWVIEAFLKSQSDAQVLPIAQLHSGFNTPVGWQLLPKTNGHDGFYYALLQKQSTFAR